MYVLWVKSLNGLAFPSYLFPLPDAEAFTLFLVFLSFPLDTLRRINVPHEKATYFPSLFPLIFNRIKFRSVFSFWRFFAFFSSFAFVSILILSVVFVSKDSAYVNVIIFSWKMFFSWQKLSVGMRKWGNCESIDVKNGKGERMNDNWQFETCFRRWQGQVWLETRLISSQSFLHFSSWSFETQKLFALSRKLT